MNNRSTSRIENKIQWNKTTLNEWHAASWFKTEKPEKITSGKGRKKKKKNFDRYGNAVYKSSDFFSFLFFLKT